MVRRTPAPRERTLSRAGIVDVALRLLDADGLDALSMRRVAAELGTGPASLYAHVRDKDDLYAAIADRAIGEVALPARPDRRRWQAQLKTGLRDWRRVLREHRDLARVCMGVIPTGENALQALDRMVGIVLASGVDEQVAAWALDILSLYVVSVAYEEAIEDRTSGPGAVAVNVSHDDELYELFAALPADRFPHLVGMAGPMTTGDGEERFEFGLDLLVRGIAASVPPRRQPKSAEPRGSHGPLR